MVAEGVGEKTVGSEKKIQLLKNFLEKKLQTFWIFLGLLIVVGTICAFSTATGSFLFH